MYLLSSFHSFIYLTVILLFYRYDYLLVTTETNKEVGKFCGRRAAGEIVWVTGNYTVITFHSDNSIGRRGFLIRFVAADKLSKWSQQREYSVVQPTYFTFTDCSFNPF